MDVTPNRLASSDFDFARGLLRLHQLLYVALRIKDAFFTNKLVDTKFKEH